MTTAVLGRSPRSVPKPSNRASNAALRAWMPPIAMLRPLALARGNVVRIRQGAGMVLHVRFGLVWITEETSRRDWILQQGESHAVSLDGLTVVHADRDSRLVLEFRSDSAERACIELARGYGEPGHRIGIRPCPASLTQRLTALARRLLAGARALRAALQPERYWHRDSLALEREAHSPEAVRHRLLHASSEPFPYY